eukprot:s8012_g4.t1
MLGQQQLQDARRYWEMERGTEWFRGHPVISAGVDLSKCIPLRLYGDGAEAFRNPACMESSSTYPSVDAWGNPLGSGLEGTKIAGEYSFVLDGVQADQDYLKILFDLQHVFSRQQCCHFCKAIQWVRADMPPTGDNDPELLYTRLVNVNEFIRLNGPTPLTSIVGFDPWRLYPDVMHILHLAVIPDAVVSVFLEYTDDESIFSGSKRDDRLEELWQLYRSWCEDGQIAERAQRKLFSTAILKNNQYVEISQKVMNATACRYMIFFLAVLGEMALQKLGPQAGNFHYWIAGVCWAFASMERIMLHGDRFLSRSDCERFYNDYLVMRGGYNHLAQRALSLQLPRWHCRPKLHQWEHTVMDYLPRNPRYYSNFLGEDFIRRAKALAVKSHPNWMARHVLLRYVLQFCLALRE